MYQQFFSTPLNFREEDKQVGFLWNHSADKPFFQAFGHGLGTGMDVQFFVDAANVVAHAVEGQMKYLPDFTIGFPPGQFFQNLLLSFG